MFYCTVDPIVENPCEEKGTTSQHVVKLEIKSQLKCTTICNTAVPHILITSQIYAIFPDSAGILEKFFDPPNRST